MAPRLDATIRSQSRMNGHAGPSRIPAQSKTNKKRQVEPESEDDEDVGEFDVDEEGIEISEDEDGDDEEEEEEGDDDEFPELDSGSEDEHVEADGVNDDTDSEQEDLDDEDSGSESGYNTSDIEAMYSSSTSVSSSPKSSGKELSIDEKLSRLVAKNTIKPDESIGTDEKISRAKEGTGRLRPSKLVPGGYLREYEDIEAGYGSESSTEDVSGSLSLRNVKKSTS